MRSISTSGQGIQNIQGPRTSGFKQISVKQTDFLSNTSLLSIQYSSEAHMKTCINEMLPDASATGSYCYAAEGWWEQDVWDKFYGCIPIAFPWFKSYFE